MNLPEPPLRVYAEVLDVQGNMGPYWMIRRSHYGDCWDAYGERVEALARELRVIPHDKNDQAAVDLIAAAKTNVKGE